MYKTNIQIEQKDNPLVSVIIAAFNVEQYIKQSVGSVRDQKYNNLEIIVVDDGSTDSTGEICDALSADDSRIKVVHKKNGGLSDARNAGLDVAHGDYISFLDADDAYHPRFVETLLCAAQENDCEISMGAFFATREQTGHFVQTKDPIIEVMSGGEAARRCHGRTNLEYIVTWNKLFKRELFDDVRYPLGEIQEDEFITWKLFLKAKRLVYVHAFLHVYLQSFTSLMGANYSRKRLQVIVALKERRDYFDNSGYYDEALSLADRINVELDDGIRILESRGEDISDLVLEKEMNRHAEDEIISHQHPFPLESIGKDSNVVIYGYGKLGRSYKKQLEKSRMAGSITCVDRFALRANKGVCSLDAVLDPTVDYVVIAIMNKEKATEIFNMLLSIGVDKEKIVIADQ